MESITVVSLLAIYIWIGWQDIKSRKVCFISYLLAFCLFFAKTLLVPVEWPDLAPVILINLTVTGLLAVMLTFYYLIRYGSAFSARLVRSIGAGDLLLLPLIIMSFAPGNFILFLIISFLIALGYGLIGQVIKKEKITIPLAGIQTLLLSPVLILEHFNMLNPLNDLIVP